MDNKKPKKLVTSINDLTPSIWKTIQEEYEEGGISIEALSKQWNIKPSITKEMSKTRKWLSPARKRKFSEELMEDKKKLRKLSNHRSKAHQQLSPQEKLIVKQAAQAVSYQSNMMEIIEESLDTAMREGIEIRSAFDLEKIHNIAKDILKLEDSGKEAPTINVNFSSSSHRPTMVVDVDEE